MSALGHYLEEEGIATVAIRLIRPQTEKTRPPRALWVPFALGRPFGPPGDPAFQRRVVLAALRLLELDRAAGPVVIEDFPDDDPRETADPAWRPPPLAAVPAGGAPAALAEQLTAEIALLADARQGWITKRGRNSVGLSGLPIPELGRYIGDWLCGREPPSPRAGVSPVLLLRFAADDLKAYYLEAGAGATAKPSARQLSDWFWGATTAGTVLIVLREALLSSDNDRIKLIGGSLLVPNSYVPRDARPATLTPTSMGPWQPGQ